jgi:hypothetical protein
LNDPLAREGSEPAKRCGVCWICREKPIWQVRRDARARLWLLAGPHQRIHLASISVPAPLRRARRSDRPGECGRGQRCRYGYDLPARPHVSCLGAHRDRHHGVRFQSPGMPTQYFNRVSVAGCAPRKSGSHLTPRWREPDSNPRSPRVGELSCRAMNAERPRTSPTNSDAGAAAVHLDFFCSACHSMEPGAGGVLAGSGLRCCSAAWARIRMFSKNPWPGNGRLNQSRNCAVEST